MSREEALALKPGDRFNIPESLCTMPWTVRSLERGLIVAGVGEMEGTTTFEPERMERYKKVEK